MVEFWTFCMSLQLLTALERLRDLLGCLLSLWGLLGRLEMAWRASFQGKSLFGGVSSSDACSVLCSTLFWLHDKQVSTASSQHTQLYNLGGFSHTHSSNLICSSVCHPAIAISHQILTTDAPDDGFDANSTLGRSSSLRRPSLTLQSDSVSKRRTDQKAC